MAVLTITKLKKPLTVMEIHRIERLASQGASLERICRRLGRTKEEVLSVANKLNIEIQTRGHSSYLAKKLLFEALTSGKKIASSASGRVVNKRKKGGRGTGSGGPRKK